LFSKTQQQQQQQQQHWQCRERVIAGDIQGQDAVRYLDPDVVLPVPPTSCLQQYLQAVQLETRRADCGPLRSLLSHSRYATYI